MVWSASLNKFFPPNDNSGRLYTGPFAYLAGGVTMKSNFMAENKDEKSELAKREEEILDFWNTNDIFKKSEENPAPNGEFVFYDGPPFATGLPHYGHILASTIKDAIPRYKTMRGFRVRRRWGWDCHGLPLENEIEKELGLETKRDIEKLGVDTFNEAARNAVLRYADDWKKIVPRFGRWVDMERDYRTMDASYTESVWWVFKQLYDKKLIYKDFKSMHLCPRCGTTLSNFEVNLGYKDITDFAVTVKLPLEDEKNTSLLVWTTTPWTLPGNMAAAVDKSKVYVVVSVEGENLIVAKERISVLGENPNVVEELPGTKLVGRRYTPPFDYYRKSELEGKKRAWKIYHAPYVSMEEGTGAVHLAPAFGDDDMRLAKTEGIPLVHHVTEEGRFAPEVIDFAGMPVKSKDTSDEPERHLSADIEIIKYLAHKGLLFKKEKITHSYPLCWRCDTPLLNYAASSWFVKVTAIRDKMVAENNKVRWVPKEVGEKRFGNWLKSARDWAISRSRYWGAPLPVWQNEKTGEHVVIGSIQDLKKYTKCSGNRYLVMRHGEAKSNEKNTVNWKIDERYTLTSKGKEEVGYTAKKLKDIDLVITSPLPRTRETAAIAADELQLDKKQIIIDDRLREIETGTFEGRPVSEYRAFFSSTLEKFTKRPPQGENLEDVRCRVGELLYELERTHKGKTILLVTHEYPVWQMMALAQGLGNRASAALKDTHDDFVQTGSVGELDFVPLPHNKNYELDLHRPYIDEIELIDRDEAPLHRVPEVFDCWYESGSMPYGQHHYPFENTKVFNPRRTWFQKSKGYPADFIAEGMDQTRGWFYSLLVLGTALFGRAPYQNVIVNGTVLAEDGQKMSKRLKNYPDPMEIVSLYGADAVRYYLLSSGVVRGDDLNFSGQGVGDISRKLITRLANVLSFYEMYKVSADEERDNADAPSLHVLDRWIVARLNTLISDTTDAMECYELDRATRPILGFVDDLSTWYLRRSRDRFKGSGDDARAACRTLQFVLMELSKVMAPFTPFYAESLYQKIKSTRSPESVHLAPWPNARTVHADERELLKRMKRTRELISLALEERTKAGVRVRQPLRRLALKDVLVKEHEEFLALMRDEVNVKEVLFDPIIEGEVMLDTAITPELKEEGMFREAVRFVQNLRKETALKPKDTAVLTVDTSAEGKKFIEKHATALRTAATLVDISFSPTEGEAVQLGEFSFRFALRRGE